MDLNAWIINAVNNGILQIVSRANGNDQTIDPGIAKTFWQKSKPRGLASTLNEMATSILTRIGEIADRNWNEIPVHFPNVNIDDYAIMPNHMHGIIQIGRRGAVSAPSLKSEKPGLMNTGDNGEILLAVNAEKPGEIGANEDAKTAPLQWSPTLGQIIGRFKYLITKTLNNMDSSPGRKI